MLNKILLTGISVLITLILSSTLYASCCIFTNSKGLLECIEMESLYNCRQYQDGTLHLGRCPGKNSSSTGKSAEKSTSGNSYMKDYMYSQCLNSCSTSCAGYKTQSGFDSCAKSCRARCKSN